MWFRSCLCGEHNMLLSCVLRGWSDMVLVRTEGRNVHWSISFAREVFERWVIYLQRQVALLRPSMGWKWMRLRRLFLYQWSSCLVYWCKVLLLSLRSVAHRLFFNTLSRVFEYGFFLACREFEVFWAPIKTTLFEYSSFKRVKFFRAWSKWVDFFWKSFRFDLWSLTESWCILDPAIARLISILYFWISVCL